MANLPSNILPIDIGSRPEARPKAAPARSQDRARFERHLESPDKERPQKPERPSISQRGDIRPTEREVPRPHHEPDTARTQPPSEPADKDRAYHASKPDRADRDRDHHGDQIRDGRSPDTAPAPSQASQNPVSEAETPASATKSASAPPATGQPAILPDPLLAVGEPEQPTPVQDEHVAQVTTADIPEPATTAPVPPDDAVPHPQPGTEDRRPALPEPALKGLRNAALHIPEHYSGLGRPGEPGLIPDAPAVPDDGPLAAFLPADETQVPDPLSGDPVSHDPVSGDPADIITDPETGEPIAFEVPEPVSAPVAITEIETLTGITEPDPLTAAPDGEQPEAMSSIATPLDVPLTEDAPAPSATESNEVVPQPSLAPAAPEPTIIAAPPLTPEPVAPQPVSQASKQNAVEPAPVGPATSPPSAEQPTPPPPAGTPQPVQATSAPQTKPTETAAPVETPVSPAPAPQAARGSLARPDTGLLSQLTDTDPATITTEPRPTLNLPGDDAAQAPSTFDKAKANAAAATPQRPAGATPNASPAVAPPVMPAGGLPTDTPISIQAAGEPQSTAPLPAQIAQNVSIRFGASPQLGANAQTPVNTLAFNIAKNFDNGVTRFQIRIDPPELGRVDVKLDMTVEGRVQAHLTVERSETLELMMRDARSLEKALAETGLSLQKDSLSFSLKDQNAFTSQDSGSGTDTNDPAAPDEMDEPLPEQMTRGYISDSGVDITV